MKRKCNWFKWRENVIDLNEEKMQWFKWRENAIY